MGHSLTRCRLWGPHGCPQYPTSSACLQQQQDCKEDTTPMCGGTRARCRHQHTPTHAHAKRAERDTLQAVHSCCSADNSSYTSLQTASRAHCLLLLPAAVSPAAASPPGLTGSFQQHPTFLVCCIYQALEVCISAIVWLDTRPVLRPITCTSSHRSRTRCWVTLAEPMACSQQY